MGKGIFCFLEEPSGGLCLCTPKVLSECHLMHSVRLVTLLGKFRAAMF